MSDTTFILGMAAIVAIGVGVPAYVRYKDARDDARRWREFMARRPCLRWGCMNIAVEGREFCADCIADMERKGIKV